MRLDTTHLFVHRRALGAEDGRGPCPGSSRFGTWLASIPDAGRLGSSRLRPPQPTGWRLCSLADGESSCGAPAADVIAV